MATFADTHASAGFSIRIADTLKVFAERMAQNRQYRETIRELNSLSSHELADLGIQAGEIRNIAYQAVYGTEI